MISIVQTTSDTRAELDELAGSLVFKRLAACGQVEGPFTSAYIWEEEMKTGKEYRLTLKTTSGHIAAIETYIKENHSYDLPEIISFQVVASKEYENWVVAETS